MKRWMTILLAVVALFTSLLMAARWLLPVMGLEVWKASGSGRCRN